MGTKIAINGFGRIGRCVARILFDGKTEHDLELVAINDLTTNQQLAHLLKYDSVHRTFGPDVSYDDDSISIGGTKVASFATRDPAELPWKDLGVDIVLECTGVFRDKDRGQQAPRGRRLPRDHQRARQGRRRHLLHRHQRRPVRPGVAHRHLERVLHHQLPRARSPRSSTRPSAS